MGPAAPSVDPTTRHCKAVATDCSEATDGAPAAAPAAAQDRTALGRSIGDLFLAVDALLDQGWVDPDRIGVHGHSLGGKLALHLAALDERVAAAVAHEPGLGLQHSNWDAPWYLGAHQPCGTTVAIRSPKTCWRERSAG